MSRVSRSLLAVLACLPLLSGCAIHPLPEDVSGVNTETIVRKIRCEARDAVLAEALRYLNAQGYHVDRVGLEGLNLSHMPFSPEVASNLAFFAQTGIVFSFTLQGTENNALGLNADFLKPISPGSRTLATSAGDTVQRDNIRAFTITDTFVELVQEVPDKYCDPGGGDPNFQYPITGRIGVDEMVSTFVDLTLFNGLGSRQDGPTNAKRGPPTMADTITFTTTVSGGLTPKVVFAPVGHAFQLADATLGLTASRIDRHSVIIGLGVPSAPVSSKPMVGALVTGAAAPKSGENAALQAVNQQILRFEVAKPNIVAP